jgi:uncharacterized protein YciI
MPEDDSVDSMKFAGSTLVVVAKSREEVLEMLNGDVYVKNGVWDMDKVGLEILSPKGGTF